MIASLLAAALERAQRRNALERRRAEQVQRALFEIASTNIDPQNPEKHYAELHRIVEGLLPAPNFCVMFYEPATSDVFVAYVKDERDSDFPKRWKPKKGPSL